jgi:hypothetical protein
MGGGVEGLVLRAGPVIQKATGERFVQPTGQKAMMYVPEWGRLLASQRAGKALFITFGLFDAISVSKVGFAAATTTGGKEHFDPKWLDFWRGKVVIVPDHGEHDAASSLASHLGWRGRILNLKYPEGTKDPNGFLEVGKSKQLIAQLIREE